MSKSEQQGRAPAGFLVVAFKDEMAADQALDAMQEARQQERFYFEAAAVFRQDAEGKVHYHLTDDMSAGKDAGIGALIGGVIGILGGPAGIALGASAGAAIGAAVSAADKSLKRETLGQVAVALKPETSAVAAITTHHFVNTVEQQLAVEDIVAAVGDLAAKVTARLGENKSVALGVLLIKGKLAVEEIAASEDAAEVVGAVIDGHAKVV